MVYLATIGITKFATSEKGNKYKAVLALYADKIKNINTDNSTFTPFVTIKGFSII